MKTKYGNSLEIGHVAVVHVELEVKEDTGDVLLILVKRKITLKDSAILNLVQ